MNQRDRPYRPEKGVAADDGQTYPTQGRFYSESGELVYEGQAKIKRIGNASWPVVVFPKGFDHLHG